MRVFARPTPLSRISLEARLVYSAFCLFMLLGYATSAWFYLDDHLGVSAEATRAYYLGAADAPPPAAQGPAVDLPGEETGPAEGAAAMQFAKSPRQVMETFHFHLFSVSVCLLIVAHLFMMCALST